MALTKQQKILLAVVAVGVVAVVIDRMVISQGATGPSGASAAADATGRAAASSADAPPKPDALLESWSAEAAGPSLSDRLVRIGERREVTPDDPTDAFAPAEAWFSQGAAQPNGSPEARESAESGSGASSAAFAERHRLMAVMTNRGAGMAIVDGQAVRLGQSLAGYTLRAVGPRKAVFDKGDVTVELKLEGKP